MRRILLAVALAACSSKKGPLPEIQSFSVDNPSPEAGAPVTFSYSVSGATGGISILPIPGPVQSSPVTVVPAGSTTFTLVAVNENGRATRDLPVFVRGLFIDDTDATPGQVAPGGEVMLSWRTTSATRVTLTDTVTGAVVDVPVRGLQRVRPSVTTPYILTAYNTPGRAPPVLLAIITARVAPLPTVASFTATPAAITQGDASTLAWSGTATAYTVSDGTTSFPLGARRSMVVRPSSTTTYTLRASGPGGEVAVPPTATVNVTPHPGTTLSYQPPAGGALQLVAEPCANPCTSLRLTIRATAPVQLRGAALDLPLDDSKVSFDPASFGVGTALAGAAGSAAAGSGPLQGAVAIGVALKGTGSAPAPDVTLAPGDELAHFSLALNPAGGRGIVFDGSTLAAGGGSSYKAIIQRATGRAASAIAVGRLEAQ